MYYSFSNEQEEFRRVLRRFLEDKSPPTEVRKLMATEKGFDPIVWQQLSDELGLQGVHIPEAYGGLGFGFVELGIVLEEMGRTLLCSPYFASISLAATAILNAGTEAQKQALLPDIASGKSIATLAVTEANGRWDFSGIETTATANDDSFTLNGSKSFVLDGISADLLIVVARTPGSTGDNGLSFFTLSNPADGVNTRLLQSLDPTRKLTEITFNNAKAELLGPLNEAAPLLSKTMDQAAVALSSEMTGGAQKLLETTADYTKMRVQFGRPIGSFQSIKHRLADLLLDIEQSKTAAYYAAAAAAEDSDQLPAVASLAKAYGSDSYMKAALECTQFHGGIGFTWENDTHLYFKRAKSSEVFLGDPNYHRDLMIERWESSNMAEDQA